MSDTKLPGETATVSRRDLFQIIGAAPAVAAVAGAAPAQTHAHHEHTAQSRASENTPFQRRTFDDHQWQTVRVLCDLIIPADDRSGSATQAGVPEFLDDWIAFRTEQDGNRDLEAEIFGGLMWLDREAMRLSQSDFAGATHENQTKILDRIAYPQKTEPDDRAWAERIRTYERYFAEGQALLHLARIEGRCVGYAFTVLHPGCDDTFPLGAGYAELYTLAVLPESRGLGIGTALLDVVDAALADAAIPNLTVAVMAHNDAAVRLYRRHGLVPGELIMYRIGGGLATPPGQPPGPHGTSA